MNYPERDRYRKRFYQKILYSLISIKSDITVLAGPDVVEFLNIIKPVSKTITSYEENFEVYRKQLEFCSKKVKFINDDIIKAYPTHIMDIDLTRTIKTEKERISTLFFRQKKLSGVKFFICTVALRGIGCKEETIEYINKLSKKNEPVIYSYRDGHPMLTFMIKH